MEVTEVFSPFGMAIIIAKPIAIQPKTNTDQVQEMNTAPLFWNIVKPWPMALVHKQNQRLMDARLNAGLENTYYVMLLLVRNTKGCTPLLFSFIFHFIRISSDRASKENESHISLMQATPVINANAL